MHYDDGFVDEQHALVEPFLKQWGEMDKIFDKGRRAATRAAITTYLGDPLKDDIRAMFRKYNEKKSFANDDEVARQLVQDVKLKLLGMDNIIGIDQLDGQFSEKDDDAGAARTGKSKTLKIYRCMTKVDWQAYKDSGDAKDVLKGHGGSLGQALHYFLKSKADDKDDVLVEFKFANTGSNLVDYTRIERGGEGKEPHNGKMTGKKERNDVMDLDEDIFSINLNKSKDLIIQLDPEITMIDKVK